MNDMLNYEEYIDPTISIQKRRHLHGSIKFDPTKNRKWMNEKSTNSVSKNKLE